MFATLETWVGQRVAQGRYEVSRLLHESKTEFVFQARDHSLGTEVVLKAPRLAYKADPDLVERFQQDVLALLPLNHRHVAPVIDVGSHEGVPFAVLRYLGGGSLKDRIKQRVPGTPLADLLQQLKTWLLPIAEALDSIRELGHSHRDVRPASILFDNEGRPFLTDWGVGTILRMMQTSQPHGGHSLGQPEYVAPELIMASTNDTRADQYALAITVFEFLAGDPPFTGPTPEAVLVFQTTRPAPALGLRVHGVPRPLADAVDRALAKEPDARFPDCVSFGKAALISTSVDTVADGVAVIAVVCPRCLRRMTMAAANAGRALVCVGCGEVILGAGLTSQQQPAGDHVTGPAPVTRLDDLPRAHPEPPMSLPPQRTRPLPQGGGARVPSTLPPMVRVKASPGPGFWLGVAGLGAVGVLAIAMMVWLISLAVNADDPLTAAKVDSRERERSARQTPSKEPPPERKPERDKAKEKAKDEDEDEEPPPRRPPSQRDDFRTPPLGERNRPDLRRPGDNDGAPPLPGRGGSNDAPPGNKDDSSKEKSSDPKPPAVAKNGVEAIFFEGRNCERPRPELTQIIPGLDFTTKDRPEGLRQHNISVVFNTFLVPPVEGEYEFSVYSRDGFDMQMFSDDNPLPVRLRDPRVRKNEPPVRGSVRLEKKAYLIRILYFNATMAGFHKVTWKVPGSKEETAIPSSALYVALPEEYLPKK